MRDRSLDSVGPKSQTPADGTAQASLWVHFVRLARCQPQAIKISSHLGEGGVLRNISFHNTEVVQAGIAINVDLGVSHPNTPTGTNTSRLSTLDQLSIVNLTATDAIGCLSSVTPGFY